MSKQETDKIFGLKEDVVSMFLGLFIVLTVLFLLFNFFRKRAGRVDLSGLTKNNTSENVELETETGEEAESVLSGSGEYQVKKGDSLWFIAEKKYGTPYVWQKISEFNNLKTTNLEIGQKLRLPDLGVKAGDLAKVTEYVVKEGDSLSKIALRAYGDMFAWNKIWQANRDLISNPNLIEVGMSLKIVR